CADAPAALPVDDDSGSAGGAAGIMAYTVALSQDTFKSNGRTRSGNVCTTARFSRVARTLVRRAVRGFGASSATGSACARGDRRYGAPAGGGFAGGARC